jgi:hypothetical protein
MKSLVCDVLLLDQNLSIMPPYKNVMSSSWSQTSLNALPTKVAMLPTKVAGNQYGLTDELF